MNGCQNLATNVAKDLFPNAKRMGQLSGRCGMFSISICMVWDSNDLLFPSGRQQQLPLRPSTAVPAFGTQPPHQSPASVRPIPTPSPTSSEPSKDPTRRTLEEIEAEEEEIDREEERLRERYRVDQERLAARRRALREERRQISNG